MLWHKRRSKLSVLHEEGQDSWAYQWQPKLICSLHVALYTKCVLSTISSLTCGLEQLQPIATSDSFMLWAIYSKHLITGHINLANGHVPDCLLDIHTHVYAPTWWSTWYWRCCSVTSFSSKAELPSMAEPSSGSKLSSCDRSVDLAVSGLMPAAVLDSISALLCLQQKVNV